jgi:hypothetical protein
LTKNPQQALCPSASTNRKSTKKTFISVAQAEKLLGKKQAGLLAELVTKPQGKPTLAPESDKRQPIGANISDFDACTD